MIRSSTFSAPATITGATELEKRKGRARCRHISTSSRRPLTQPPEAPPSALPSVVVITSIFPKTPQCSCVPRPVLPMKPVACESSRNTMASYFSASATISSSLAMSPSIENTPSVMIMREALVLMFLQLLLQVPHVGMLVGVLHRLAQAHAVHDRGVHQPVGDHHVLLVQAGLEEAGIRVHAGGKEQGVFGAEKLGEPVLEFAMDVLRAANEAHRGHAVAAASSPACAAAITSGWLESPR